jgi:signal transduction histidine kinase
MSRGGSIGPIWGIAREFGARLHFCLFVWAAVTRRAATRVGSAEKGRAMKLRAALLIACTGLAMAIAGCLPVSAATRHVVLLYDERVELPGLSLLDTELVNTLRSNSSEPIEIYREVMDLSRFNSNSYKTALRDFLRAKYAGKKIDVAVAVMAPAFDFLLTYGDLIFPSAPIVFCGLDRMQLGTRSLPSNVYGVLLKREFAPTVELALRIHPSTKRFVVVAGTSEFDKSLLAQARDQFRSYENRVSFSYLSELPLEQLLTSVSKLPPEDVVLFLTLFQDGTGQPFIPHEVVERVSSAASVPVYGFLDQYLGRGIVGGSLYSVTAHGSETAKLVLRLLTDAAPSQNLSESSSNRIIFDWRQMLRWGISESRLPPNSEIYFREKAVWEQYLWQIMFVGAIILVQAGLISILLHEHLRRRLAEVQARQRMAELAHINRFSTAGELTASISHEINQPLGAILTNAETARAILKSPYPDLDELNEIVDDILQDDRRASEVIRRMRSLLRKAPFEPKDIDLNDLVRETIGFLSALAVARKVELASSITPDPLPIVGDCIQLQQVILNLVVNAIDAMSDTPGEKRITSLRTSRVEKFAELSISDRGPGIPADRLKDVFEPFFTTKAEGMGMGLSIARTIVGAHNGQISAVNEPGAGAVFRVRLPIARHTVAPAQPAFG